MKMKIFMVLLCLLLSGSLANSTETESTGVNCSGLETSYQSSKTRPGSNDHKHCYSDKNTDTNTHRDVKFGRIVEVKVPLIIKDKFDINSKTGWDTANEEGYTTVQLDVKLEEGLLQKLVKLFKKGE